MTAQYLTTAAGQVYVVLLATQTVKSALPWLDAYWLRLVCMLLAIGLHVAMAWAPTWRTAEYVVALVNGAMVAMAAMKTSEFVKGSTPAPSAPSEVPPPSPTGRAS